MMKPAIVHTAEVNTDGVTKNGHAESCRLSFESLGDTSTVGLIVVNDIDFAEAEA